MISICSVIYDGKNNAYSCRGIYTVDIATENKVEVMHAYKYT